MKKKVRKNYEGPANSSAKDEDSLLCKWSGVEVKVKMLSRLIVTQGDAREFHARDGILSRSKERRRWRSRVKSDSSTGTGPTSTVRYCICIFNEAGSSCRWRVTTNASIANATRYEVGCQSTSRRLSNRSMSKMSFFLLPSRSHPYGQTASFRSAVRKIRMQRELEDWEF